MTALERAIVEIVGVLEALNIDYMLIGGIANAVWGEPRATVDVDVTITVDEESLADTIAQLGQRLQIAVTDPVPFVRQTRVLPVDTQNGVRGDVIFAVLPFEIAAVRRARTVRLAGRDIRVVTPEDLILMKVISERPRDVTDAEGLTRRRLDELDLGYLDPLVREMATLLERPEILERWRSWTRK